MAKRALSARERKQLVAYVASLRKDFVQELLDDLDQPKSGIKLELRNRLDQALVGHPERVRRTIEFLDLREPWGKQQVELFDIPRGTANRWRDDAAVRASLRAGNAEWLLDEPRHLALPADLALTSAAMKGDVTEIRAVEAREYYERDPSRDFEEQDGILEVRYRAQVKRVSRVLFMLRIDAKRRRVSLHVTQADRGYNYQEARARFLEAVDEIFDLSVGTEVDLRPAVIELHQREEQALAASQQPLTRGHRVAVRLASGHMVALTSATADDAMVSDPVVKATVAAASSAGTSSLGNVYFLPGSNSPVPADEEVHVIIAASEGHISIRNPTTEAVVGHIVDTIRGLC